LYHKQISKNIDCSVPTVQDNAKNLQEEHPTIMFGPHIEERGDTIGPFYVTLIVTNHLLHNCFWNIEGVGWCGSI